MNSKHSISIRMTPLQFSKDAVIAPSAALTQTMRNQIQINQNRNPGTRRSQIQQFAKKQLSCNETTNTTIKAYSQILNEERDPGLESKIETTNETVSLNSNSGL
jgi:hypothetical protein